MGERTYAVTLALGVGVDDHLQPKILGELITELGHGPELPQGVDVHQRKRKLRGMKGLQGQVKHDRAVFADRVQHDGILGLCSHFTHDVNGLGLKLFQVSEHVGVLHG